MGDHIYPTVLEDGLHKPLPKKPTGGKAQNR